VHSAAHLQQLLESEAALRGDASCVVAVDCEGVPKALHLIQLAYFTMEGVKRVIIIDGVAIGEVNMIKLLAPLLTSESTVKLFHDLHMDAAAFANIGCLQLANCVDSQLVMELRYGTLLQQNAANVGSLYALLKVCGKTADGFGRCVNIFAQAAFAKASRIRCHGCDSAAVD
jgi:hypothetical protein